MNYLSGNKKSDVPWYEREPNQDHNIALSNREISIIEYHDPLNQIKKELKKRKDEEMKKNNSSDFRRNRFQNRRVPNKSGHLRITGRDARSVDSDYKRRNQVYNDDKRKNQVDNDDKRRNQETRTELSEKELKLKELRDKRLKRESKESQKAKDLVNKNFYANGVNEDRGRPYYNQFNPHLSRN